MTVSTTAVPVTYPGDGVTTVFSYPYKFLSTSDIKVYVGGVLKTLTTDYSVGAPSDSGANVTFVTAPGAASGIVFIQDPDSLQSSKLPSNGPFPSSTVERMVDKLTLQVQRLKSLLSRSLTLSDGDSTTASTVLPTPTASSLIGWNSSGNALQNYAGSSSALVSPAMVPVVGASTLALGRAALGAGVIGDALFLTATAAAARAAIGLAAGADIASAATLPLAARTGNLVRVTGVVPVTATDLENGGSCWVIAVGALPLTYHVTNMPLQGGVDHTCQAGTLLFFERDGSGALSVLIFSKNTLLSALGVRFATGNLVGVASTIPTTGTYTAGDIVLEMSASVIGLSGWKRLTTGSAHVLGTDWKYFGGVQSMVRLNTGNGFGSTNTAIRRFTNVVTNQGNDITYADSATLGASFTINTPGVYSISYTDSLSTQNVIGISLNSNQLTTYVLNITAADALEYKMCGLAQYPDQVTAHVYLPAGSVIRAHSNVGLANGANGIAKFTITRVG